MNRKDKCSVYTINGFMKDRIGQFRIVVLAENREYALDHLGFRNHIAGTLLTVSRDTRDWTAFDDSTSIGDIFVVPFGTHTYEPVDAEQITLG